MSVAEWASGFGHRGQQCGGVRVCRGGQDILGGALLADAPEVEHRDVVADRADHAQVVGDEQPGESEGFGESAQQVEHGGLRGDVERGDGFVGDQHVRFGGEGAGDGDALGLAAGQLCGEALGEGVGGQPDGVQEFAYAGVAVDVAGGVGVCVEGFGDDVAYLAVRVGDVDGGEQFGGGAVPVAASDALPAGECLGDLVGDAYDGVERGHRVLVDHGDLGARERGAAAGVEVEDVVAVQAHVAGAGGAGAAAVDAQDGAAEDGLSRSALADHARTFPGVDAQV